jgi:hypothetical protein
MAIYAEAERLRLRDLLRKIAAESHGLGFAPGWLSVNYPSMRSGRGLIVPWLQSGRLAVVSQGEQNVQD